MTIKENSLDNRFDPDRGALLEAVIKTAPNGLIILDEKGIIQSFNIAAERMFGYKATEIIGQNISLLMSTSLAEKHDGFVRRYLLTGQKNIIDIGREVMARKKNNTLFPIELAVGEVTSNGQRLFTGFVSDLTEQRISQKQIAKLQSELVHVARHSAMGELASTLAHELNQPLTAIANYTLASRQLVEDIEGSAQKQMILEMLDKAAAQAERAGDIIRSIRSFVKHHDNEFGWEQLDKVVSEAVEIATIGTSRHQIDVRIKKAGVIPDVCLDRVQIQQVVTNLVRNAIDAVAGQEGKRTVWVELSRHGARSVIVRILDNGPGITPHIQKNLFEAFNTNKHEGVGIGLAVSKTIISSHNGEIRGKNRPEGGAEFTFVLPIDSKAEEIG